MRDGNPPLMSREGRRDFDFIEDFNRVLEILLGGSLSGDDEDFLESVTGEILEGVRNGADINAQIELLEAHQRARPTRMEQMIAAFDLIFAEIRLARRNSCRNDASSTLRCLETCLGIRRSIQTGNLGDH